MPFTQLDPYILAKSFILKFFNGLKVFCMNNLVGQVFGKWTVLSKSGRTSRGETTYLCECTCGSRKIQRGSTLKAGESTQCKSCFVDSLNKTLDLVGKKFGSWLVASRFKNVQRNELFYTCICDCGTRKNIPGHALKSGQTKQCNKCRCSKRGAEYLSTKLVWRAMIARCSNKNLKVYKYYGGRGITVCKRWHSYDNFVEDMGLKPLKLQIDRIDNDGNYEPSNCRWVTARENSLNRRIPQKRSLKCRFSLS